MLHRPQAYTIMFFCMFRTSWEVGTLKHAHWHMSTVLTLVNSKTSCNSNIKAVSWFYTYTANYFNTTNLFASVSASYCNKVVEYIFSVTLQSKEEMHL